MVSALHLLQLAQTAEERAASYIRNVERPSDPQGWTLKGARDFVTEVDRTAERMIADILLTAEPGGRLVGEELSPTIFRATRFPSPRQWMVCSKRGWYFM